MSGERVVRLQRDTTVDSRCHVNWRVSNARPTFICEIHQTEFYVGRACPKATQLLREGEEVSLPVRLANRLVSMGAAVTPVPPRVLDERDQGQLDRMNAVMEREGLEPFNASVLDAIRAPSRGARSSGDPYGLKRTARPKDRRLAQHTGLSPVDIAEMRKLAGGK